MWIFTAAILVVYLACGFSATLENKTTAAPVETTTLSTTTTAVPFTSNSTYLIRNGTNICLLLQMDLVLRIPYFNKKGESLIGEFYLNHTNNKNVFVVGNCTLTYQFIQLSWAPTADTSALISTLLNFTVQTKDEVYGLSSVVSNFTMSDKLFPGTNDTADYSVSANGSHFICPLNYYYQCKSAQTFQLTPSAGKNPSVMYEMSNLKVEAFRNKPNETFIGKPRECTADSATDRIVPIIVGVALAVMILVAILTFIIASRRRRVGYQTI